MEHLRVLIADDHPMFRHGVQTLLASTPGLAVAGEARTGQEAIDLAETLQPDIILMDLQMPELNGIEATRQILAANPQIRILMATMFCSPTAPCGTTSPASSASCRWPTGHMQSSAPGKPD